MCIGGRIRCCDDIKKSNPIIIPLVGASATAKIVDYTAEVTIKQRYENQMKGPIEAMYILKEIRFEI